MTIAITEVRTPPARPTSRVDRFIAERAELPTPFLVIDLDVVAERYLSLAAALPGVDLFYAVKANPADEVITLLDRLGARFDVASPGEIDLCLSLGVRPDHLSYGNTIKKSSAIRYAVERGVTMFAFDSEEELNKLLGAAPGATLTCRVLCDGTGADWPLSRKFGCHPELAAELLVTAHEAGHPIGVSFHVGSQQRDPGAWDRALADVADLADTLADAGVRLELVNLGGGFPAHYHTEPLPPEEYGRAILDAVSRRLGPRTPRLLAEPGRYLVADAGVIESEVVAVSRKGRGDDRRWVYLDVGVFGGLVECLGESIKYRIRTPHDGRDTGPVVIAGPTCDSADILYDHSDYRLPLELRAGDRVQLLSTGAYTATYASVGFNGFGPMETHVLSAS